VELESLTQLIESMWTQHKPPVSPHSLDLDEMFNFLREDRVEHGDVVLRHAGTGKEQALDAINQQFEQLDVMWKETEKVGWLCCLVFSFYCCCEDNGVCLSFSNFVYAVG
jgi:hypothetical protein